MPEVSLPPTPRLKFQRLRAESTADQVFMLRLLNEPAFLSHIGDRGVRTLDLARDYMHAQVVPDYRHPGQGFHRLALAEGNQPVGICGIIQRGWLPHPDLGYALLPEFSRHGYAREAARAVLEYSRAALGLGRVLAITHTDNQPSIRLLEALGFHFEGTTQAPNNDRELNLFASDPTAAR
ncbi:GNAT family N-acetyltransferase [Pseudoxanthomonas dokdonensis]|uniref:N-acetyltransferase domain-containing protein n=1 Tax=Pseudoxanthomonas dokdonensis TaxID=344882 RepID=A0A0R0CFH4_9GAMM|nr:GNAT family N-acetyltransferase [Pseudoxanthomonas dokdonensis]KRG68080.1 hypothetical protein ABB29_15080 [Pseudoxanthomonas dokdonensis]